MADFSNYPRINLEVYNVSYYQSVPGSYSVVTWSARMTSDDGYAWSYGNITGGNLQIDAVSKLEMGSLYYNLPGGGSCHLASVSTVVYHSAAKSVRLGTYVVANYTGLGTATAYYDLYLPAIVQPPPPPPPTVNYLNGTPYAEAITDVQFNVAVNVDTVCDNLATSLDGAGWVYWTGDWSGWKVVTLGGNLSSNEPHTFKTSIRRKDSGLWNESTVKTVTTLSQGNFIGLL